jgi:release factor glutamine methyltransferase
MRADDYLAQKTEELKTAGLATARLDCLVLLEDVLNTNRTQILAHPEREITEAQQQDLNKMIAQRAQHIPLAYIRGKSEFYGREFTINQYVLEPRPESETMIDLLKSLDTSDQKTIIDVGTGSGALAITVALELPDAKVLAIDIDPNCLDLSATNTKAHNVELSLIQSDLLSSLPKDVRNKPATLLCNLPYVPDNFQINTAATHEPRLAIFGGPDGLDLFRRLFDQLQNVLPGNTFVLCESLPPQHAELAEIAISAGFELIAEQDFIQLFKRV